MVAATTPRNRSTTTTCVSRAARSTTQRCGASLDVPFSSAQKPARLTPVAPRRSTRPTAWNRTTLATPAPARTFCGTSTKFLCVSVAGPDGLVESRPEWHTELVMATSGCYGSLGNKAAIRWPRLRPRTPRSAGHSDRTWRRLPANPATSGSLACDGRCRRGERERPSSRFDTRPQSSPDGRRAEWAAIRRRTRTPKLGHRPRASGMDDIAQGMAAVVGSGGAARRSFR